jgi:hypothetical protein
MKIIKQKNNKINNKIRLISLNQRLLVPRNNISLPRNMQIISFSTSSNNNDNINNSVNRNNDVNVNNNSNINNNGNSSINNKEQNDNSKNDVNVNYNKSNNKKNNQKDQKFTSKSEIQLILKKEKLTDEDLYKLNPQTQEEMTQILIKRGHLDSKGRPMPSIFDQKPREMTPEEILHHPILYTIK